MAWPTDRRPADILTGEGVPELWSAKFFDHTRSGLVALQACNSTWGSELSKGDKLYITIMSELTVADVDVTADAVLTNMNTDFFGTAVSITVDKWKECPVMIDDSSRAQTQIPALLEQKVKDASYAWNKTVDAEAFSLLSSLTSTWAGSDGQTFTDDLLLDIMEGLDEANIPEKDRALVCDPSVITDARKIDKFMTFDYSNNPLRAAGYRGRIDAYDLPLFYTNNLTAATTGNYCAVLHKDAIGIGMQSPMKIEGWREGRRHSDVINTSGFYGIDVLRSTFGAYFYSRKS